MKIQIRGTIRLLYKNLNIEYINDAVQVWNHFIFKSLRECRDLSMWRF